MKKAFSLLLYLIITKACFSQQVEIVKVEELIKKIHTQTDSTYVVNFWATWCAPCVKELPYFDSINKTYHSSKVKVLLVSLDFKENLDSKLIPFISNKGVQSEVVLLDESNGNYFIPLISEEWTGSLPSTLIINTKKKINRFYEKKLSLEFLTNEIDQIIGNPTDQ